MKVRAFRALLSLEHLSYFLCLFMRGISIDGIILVYLSSKLLINYEMLKVLAFMKQVATGLQMEGNFGTAHVYRSSLNAIIAYRGKNDFVFSEVTSEWLKGFEVYLRSRGCSWNTVSTIYGPFVRFTIVRSIFRRLLMFLIYFVLFIPERGLTINVRWVMTI